MMCGQVLERIQNAPARLNWCFGVSHGRAATSTGLPALVNLFGKVDADCHGCLSVIARD